MNTSLLYAYTVLLARRLREDEGTPEALFIATQLDKVAQLLEFTGAETPDQFEERTEQNHEWVKEAEYDRGYEAGRSAVYAEMADSRWSRRN
jgi:hypothetical protein